LTVLLKLSISFGSAAPVVCRSPQCKLPSHSHLDAVTQTRLDLRQPPQTHVGPQFALDKLVGLRLELHPEGFKFLLLGVAYLGKLFDRATSAPLKSLLPSCLLRLLLGVLLRRWALFASAALALRVDELNQVIGVQIMQKLRPCFLLSLFLVCDLLRWLRALLHIFGRLSLAPLLLALLGVVASADELLVRVV